MPLLDINDSVQLERYNRFVRSHPAANATQDVAWGRIKSNWKSEYVYIEKGGEITGAMSLIIRAALGRSMVYATRGPICDIHDLPLVRELLDEVLLYTKNYRPFLIRFDPEVKYSAELEKLYSESGFIIRNKGYGKEELIQPRFNMMLDLQGFDADSLFKTFSEKTRYNIRYAQKKGVTVRFSRDKSDLETFFELYKITAVRDRIGRREYDYFEAMLEAFKGDELRLYIAEHEGEALSGAIAIHYGGKMWYIYGASSNEKRNLMPNYAMQWEMIRWALQCGCRIYDFGGVFELDKQDGLYKFKEGFCRKDGVTELIGEIDMPLSKPYYLVLTKVLPWLKRIKSKLKKGKF